MDVILRKLTGVNLTGFACVSIEKMYGCLTSTKTVDYECDATFSTDQADHTFIDISFYFTQRKASEIQVH